MAGASCPQDVLIAKLETRFPLSENSQNGLRGLPCIPRTIPAQSYMLREGTRPTKCCLLLDGFAFRHKLAADGGRQIVGLMIPGDFTDLQHLFLREADHNIQALTRIDVAEFAVDDLRALALKNPDVAQALWIDTLIEASIVREAILNIGRRNGPMRLAHMLCEFEVRLRQSGLADAGYDLPMTQEQIGDATGMTAVHVNRTLKQLEREGLIVRVKRHLKIADWVGLQQRADFNPLYLHLDQARPAD